MLNLMAGELLSGPMSMVVPKSAVANGEGSNFTTTLESTDSQHFVISIPLYISYSHRVLKITFINVIPNTRIEY